MKPDDIRTLRRSLVTIQQKTQVATTTYLATVFSRGIQTGVSEYVRDGVLTQEQGNALLQRISSLVTETMEGNATNADTV